MDKPLSPLEQVKADAMRLTLKRIRENAEEQGLPVPPRAAGYGNVVLPKAKKEAEPVVELQAEPAEEVPPVETEEPKVEQEASPNEASAKEKKGNK